MPSRGGFARCLIAIGNQYGARIQVSEVPPGPPVIQTLVAEVYGPDLDGQTRVAQQIKSIFQHTAGVVDTDWYVEDPQPRLAMQVDEREGRAARHRGRGCRPCTGAGHIGDGGWPAPRSQSPASRFPRWCELTRAGSLVGAGAREHASSRVPTARWFRCANWSPSSTTPSSAASITRICGAWCMSPATWPARKRAPSTPS